MLNSLFRFSLGNYRQKKRTRHVSDVPTAVQRISINYTQTCTGLQRDALLYYYALPGARKFF
jgi:hypothetical protein